MKVKLDVILQKIQENYLTSCYGKANQLHLFARVMINQTSIDKIKRAHFSTSFCKPLYDSYCFSRIPSSIKKLLTAGNTQGLPQDCFSSYKEPYDIVILLLLDGFGWTFFEKYVDRFPFLQRFVKEGVVSKITSQFPSTTAAHVTTLQTGLEVGQTGVYEWFYYEPKVDRMIAPLLFSYAGDKTLDSLYKDKISPSDIFPTHTFYQDLKHHGVDSFVVQHESIVHSSYSKTMGAGAHPLSYLRWDQGLSDVVEAAYAPSGTKAFFMVYFSDIDSAGHRHGIDSEKFNQAIETCLNSLESAFWQPLRKTRKKVACLVTADHGMVPVSPSRTIYLNKEIPQLSSLLKVNQKGVPLVPAGSCRDFFLHVKEDKVQEAKQMLTQWLQNKAEVYEVKELIRDGFFGEKPCSELFLQRVGNLVVLPYENEAVWWYEKNRFEQHFYAAHGGLTRHEMESIFLFQEV